MPKKTGFTLVELLVSISIISILSVIGLTTYNGVQARARDAKRTDDLQQIKKALHLYHSSSGTFCFGGCSWSAAVNSADYGFKGTAATSLKNSGMGAYFNNGAIYDPKNSTGSTTFAYDYYLYIIDQDRFFLCAKFETTTANTYPDNCNSGSGNTYNYRISESD